MATAKMLELFRPGDDDTELSEDEYEALQHDLNALPMPQLLPKTDVEKLRSRARRK